MTTAKQYQIHIKDGMCVQCGRPNPLAPDRRRCQECLDKQTARYHSNPERFKKQALDRKHSLIRKGLCTNCGKRSPIPHSYLCVECSQRANALRRYRYALNAESNNRRSHDQRVKWKKEHRCTRCGKPLDPGDPRFTCGCSSEDIPRNYHIGGKVYYGIINQAGPE